MASTANGFPVIFERKMSRPGVHLRNWTIPLKGQNRTLLLRDGAYGFILAHVALWFHEAVEALNHKGQVWDEWGWAVRPIRGQTAGYSNHAGAVAIDLNATLHPRGKDPRKSFSKIKIALIHTRLRLFYRGLVIWGGDWRLQDGMHFELKFKPPALRRLARMLMNTPRGRRILAANPGARKDVLSTTT